MYIYYIYNFINLQYYIENTFKNKVPINLYNKQMYAMYYFMTYDSVNHYINVYLKCVI